MFVRKRHTRAHPNSTFESNDDSVQLEARTRRTTDSSKALYCCSPVCSVRLKNGMNGKRIKSNTSLIRMSEELYKVLRTTNGIEFHYEESDVLCKMCHIIVSSAIIISDYLESWAYLHMNCNRLRIRQELWTKTVNISFQRQRVCVLPLIPRIYSKVSQGNLVKSNQQCLMSHPPCVHTVKILISISSWSKTRLLKLACILSVSQNNQTRKVHLNQQLCPQLRQNLK